MRNRIKTMGLAMVVLEALLVAGVFDRRASQALAQQAPHALVLDLGNKVTMKLVVIPAGKFLMGSTAEERHALNRDELLLNEGLPKNKWVKGDPRVEVTISKPFYMGVYHVTVDQYAQFLKDTGQKHEDPLLFPQTGEHPVVHVTWNNANAFCDWLSKKTNKTVVLPTEAQWEYACRAGTQTSFSFGDDYHENLDKYGWSRDNSEDEPGPVPVNLRQRMTHPVGQKKPNAWGLYDMHGNAFQWCSDWYAENYAGPAVDPTGPKTNPNPIKLHVLRGGCCNVFGWLCGSARRWSSSGEDEWRDYYGFRVVVLTSPSASPGSMVPQQQPSDTGFKKQSHIDLRVGASPTPEHT